MSDRIWSVTVGRKDIFVGEPEYRSFFFNSEEAMLAKVAWLEEHYVDKEDYTRWISATGEAYFDKKSGMLKPYQNKQFLCPAFVSGAYITPYILYQNKTYTGYCVGLIYYGKE